MIQSVVSSGVRIQPMVLFGLNNPNEGVKVTLTVGLLHAGRGPPANRHVRGLGFSGGGPLLIQGGDELYASRFRTLMHQKTGQKRHEQGQTRANEARSKAVRGPGADPSVPGIANKTNNFPACEARPVLRSPLRELPSRSL